MANSGFIVTISVFILCTIFSKVSSLQCYECSSLLDEKCGKTWGYDGNEEEAEKYLKTCVGNTVACRKIENDGEMEGFAVTRSCWSSDSAEFYTPETDCKKMHNGYVCYCKGDEGEKPCNGKQLLQPQIAPVLLGLFLLVARLAL